MKKVIFFRKALTTEGGAERLMLEVADKFIKFGVEVRIVVVKGKDMGKFFDGQYSHLSVKMFWEGDYPQNLIGKIWLSLLSVFKLRKIIKEEKPDLIVGQNDSDAESIFFATLGTPYQYSTFIHGSFFCFPEDLMKYTLPFRGVFDEIRNSVLGHKDFIPKKRPTSNPLKILITELRAWLDYWAVNKAKLVFCLSERMGSEVSKLYKRPSIALKPGINNAALNYEPKNNLKEKYRVPKDKFMAFDVSRLIDGKRVDLGIKTIAELAKRRDDIYLVVGGKGPEKEKLEKMIDELNVREKVNLAGFVPEEDLWDLYCSSDVVLHPAWIDFDITVMEALALGKKVACSTEFDVSGSLLKLKDRAIFQANPDPKSMADAVEKALSAPGVLREEMRNILKEYTWDSYSKKLYSHFFNE